MAATTDGMTAVIADVDSGFFIKSPTTRTFESVVFGRGGTIADASALPIPSRPPKNCFSGCAKEKAAGWSGGTGDDDLLPTELASNLTVSSGVDDPKTPANRAALCFFCVCSLESLAIVVVDDVVAGDVDAIVVDGVVDAIAAVVCVVGAIVVVVVIGAVVVVVAVADICGTRSTVVGSRVVQIDGAIVRVGGAVGGINGAVGRVNGAVGRVGGAVDRVGGAVGRVNGAVAGVNVEPVISAIQPGPYAIGVSNFGFSSPLPLSELVSVGSRSIGSDFSISVGLRDSPGIATGTE